MMNRLQFLATLFAPLITPFRKRKEYVFFPSTPGCENIIYFHGYINGVKKSARSMDYGQTWIDQFGCVSDVIWKKDGVVMIGCPPAII